MNRSPPIPEPRRQLAALLRDQQAELIQRWAQRVIDDPRIPQANRLTRPELRDEVPALVDRLAEDLDAPDDATWETAGAGTVARGHARQRFLLGYGIAQALRELGDLRTEILALWGPGAQIPRDAAMVVHARIDETMIAGADEMERLSREKGEWLSDLLDQSHEAVLVWKLGGGIVLWNQGAEELYGWTAAEAVGQSPHALLHTRPVNGELRRIEDILAREGRWEGELRHVARDGRALLVEGRLVIRPHAGETLVLEMNRDVTERRRAEGARRESEGRLRAIVDNAVDAILTIDELGTVQTLNPAAERMFGYAARDVIGKNVTMLMPDPYRHEHDAYLAHYRETGERRIIGIGREVTGRHRTGSTFPIDLAVSEIPMGDRRIFTGVLRDITERKRAEEEREQVLSSERAARTEAERATRLRDEFVATVSHELRTPLNAILGWTGMLRRGKLDEAASAKALEVVERNARAQAELVEDLLDIARIGSGKLRLDVRPVNIAAILENVIASHQPAAQAKGVRIDRALSTEGCTIRGDPGRVEQIASNLLSNAVKFTPRAGRVCVTCKRVGSQAELVVSDTGKGIEADFLPHVFDRFRQAEASLTRHHRGLGLGLSLVKYLVEQHGGDIRAESPGPGLGSTFTVLLPIAAVGLPDGKPSPIDACHSLAGARALVIDDEEDARTLLRRILEDCEVEVTACGSATEALEQLPRIRPDVIISDIGMPELDGYQLIRAVRALPAEQGGATPAVALTAFARPEDRLRALRAGYQMHLAKPVDQAELLVVVASLTGRLKVPASGEDGL